MNTLSYREAQPQDLEQIWRVRLSVKENILLDTDGVTDEVTIDYLTRRGKGWVCEKDKTIVGFSIVDLIDHNIWALFVEPEFENQGIGKELQRLMLDWYFSQTTTPAHLETSGNTRAEGFYLKNGWTQIEHLSDGNIKFLMTYDSWLDFKKTALK
jgi:GNAT superfamily N-acetyltransferase